MTGKTIDIEFDMFQPQVRPLYMYFTEPADIVLSGSQMNASQVFISSIGNHEDRVQSEFMIALNLTGEQLYAQHASKFSAIWNNGRIETDNFVIQTNIYSSLYYILSSLPAPDHYGMLNQFYGLSPGSLSRGALLEDYQGHSFWDTG